MTRLVRAAVSVTVLLVVLLTCQSAGAAPMTRDMAAVDVRRTEPLQLGVTVFALWRDSDRLDELFDRARDAGTGWVRVDMGWCTLEEQGPGVISAWYQERLDATVAAAAARRLRLLVDVGCAPGWAGGDGYQSYPKDPAQFERVMTYLAARYRGRVPAWELWNEPDCFDGCPNGSPETFVQQLEAGYKGVKAGDPAAIVVSGGTSGNNADWIGRMYAAGGKGWFDALAVHPYLDPPTAPPDAPSEARIYRLTTLPYVHAQMVAHGDGGKPIWITEFGWSTANTGDRTGVDEPTQARYLTQAVQQIQRDYPYVTHAFWYTMRDRDDSTPYENAFGLLHVDGSEKPAFGALRELTVEADS